MAWSCLHANGLLYLCQENKASKAARKENAEVPYLPPELWTIILGKTDVHTCFNYKNFVAARTLLQSEAGRDKAIELAALGGQLQDLELLVSKMGITPTDSMILIDMVIAAGTQSLTDLNVLAKLSRVLEWLTATAEVEKGRKAGTCILGGSSFSSGLSRLQFKLTEARLTRLQWDTTLLRECICSSAKDICNND